MPGKTPRDTTTTVTEQTEGRLWIEYAPLHEIRKWDQNPKDHDIGEIITSIRRFGFVESPVVNETTGTLVAGHGRLEALEWLFEEAVDHPPKNIIALPDGDWGVPVERGNAFRDDDEAAAYVLASNRTVEIGGWHDAKLVEIGLALAEKDKIYGTGFDTEYLQGIALNLKTQADEDKEEEEDEERDDDRDSRQKMLMEKWGVESGQVWKIPSNSLPGRNHRITIGDSTDPNVWELAMDGLRAQLLVTSPPYGVGKEYEDGGHEQWAELLRDVFSMAFPYVPLLAVNLADVKVGPHQRELHTYGDLIDILEQCNYPLIGTRIWTKNPAWLSSNYSFNSYRGVDEYEFIGLFGSAEYKNRIDTDWRYRSVWNFGSVAKNDLHPAAFPVELPSRLIQLLTDRNGLVAEPFFGSGTTMLAAEQNGRICYGIERDPKYIAVALERASELGLTPRRAETH